MSRATGGTSIVVRIPQELDERIAAMEADTGSDRSTVVRTLLNVALDTPQKFIVSTETLWIVHGRIRKAIAFSTREILDAVSRNLTNPASEE